MGTVDSWSSIETIIRQRLDRIEFDRRYCVVCDRQGPSLSRCFGCQMVYYCGEQHQADDWTREHAQRCAQLEWVALGEFIQALPAQPPLPELGDKWSLSLKEISTSINWFSIRTNIVNLANNTAHVLHKLVHLTDKRQPTYQNAVDGLLAAVTDHLTHVLTIGKALVHFDLQPHTRPIVVRILTGFNKLDLAGHDHQSSSAALPARFHELLNMFPDNKGVELVIVIGDDDDDDDDDQDDTDQSSLPHAKLRPDRLIITTLGKGRLFDTFEEKRLQPPISDLFVYLNAAQLFSASNRELLQSMLTRARPTLLTFDDEHEFNQAKTQLSSRAMRMSQAGVNPFGSLIIRQRPNQPNSIYSTNSYQILLKPMPVNANSERNDETMLLLSRQRAHQSSMGIQHAQTQLQQRQQQLNPGSKQVNGKTHIESPSSSSSSSSSSYNTQANNGGTPLDTNVRIVSSTNTATTPTTVQPSLRSTNCTRQPAIAQRRHHSPPTSPTVAAPIHSDIRPTIDTMMTAIDFARNDTKPQPKPRLSLVKPTRKLSDSLISPCDSISLVQRIKPFFEPSPIPTQQESKSSKQQRPPVVSIPYTYQTGAACKVTCLDDVIASHRNNAPSIPMETRIDDRAMRVVASPTPIETRHERRSPMAVSVNAIQLSRPAVDHRADDRTIKALANKVSSPLTVPIEIHHDHRTAMRSTTIASPLPSTHVEHRFDERVAAAVPPVRFSSPLARPTESAIDEPVFKSRPISPSPPPPARPPPPVTNEVIYTEVIKNHERSLAMDSMKSPLSPSRSFVIPTKSPSISSKNSSFHLQRPSRLTSSSTTNFSFHTPKSRPFPSTMTSDRISLYSQRSTKQSDAGVTIKNLSECIDRVGIVFDETNRPSEPSSGGLTTVDLIREQLASSSSASSKPTESLLDKLYKSNSNTRLSKSSSRSSMTYVLPRSKSQQATRTHEEPVLVPKTMPTSPTMQTNRRTAGIFLPITPKVTQEPEKAPSTPTDTSFALVYQNLDLHSITPSRTPDYTLKQPVGPLCTGVPKPFRKPTAIIEPSPVLPATPAPPAPEPNYINLAPQDEHIYSNENGSAIVASSNSNSYTSKTSSIYSSSDKQTPSSRPDTLYAVSTVPSLPTQHELSVEYDSFDDELAGAEIQGPRDPGVRSNDNTDDDSFDDDDDQHPNPENSQPVPSTPSKNAPAGFFRSTLNRLTRSNKSLDRVGLTNEPAPNESILDPTLANAVDTRAKKTLRSIKARHEAKKTGTGLSTYAGGGGDDDTTSIDSNCSTQTATSLNKTGKLSHQRFRLFRRKVEKEFASDTEAEKHQTEQRRKKWSKKMLHETADELKAKRLLMMSDDDDDDPTHFHAPQKDANVFGDETHIYDHIVHDEINNNNNNASRMGKLSHETHFKSPTITLDEIRSEIQAEIAARQDPQTSSGTSTFTMQKKRSKSVTFLDELLVDDSKQKSANLLRKADPPVKPSTHVKRIEKGDARSICGALTGTGPIRGIIKAANNDITGTTAPISPSAAAAIYLSGTSAETRCTSPKVNERSHRPMSTYTVGSARFYDGEPVASAPVSPPTNVVNQMHSVSTHRPILNNTSSQSTSDSANYKRPTAKVSPFQTKSSNDASSSSPVSMAKQPALSSASKKHVRPSMQRPTPVSHEITSIAMPSVSEVVGGVSKRLQSNF